MFEVRRVNRINLVYIFFRSRKCNICYRVLMDIRSVIDKKTSLAGKVGDTFRQLQILLGTLD